MSVEYLLVVYKEDRDVLADGDRVGVTNHTILLAPDEYIITLGVVALVALTAFTILGTDVAGKITEESGRVTGIAVQ